LPVALRAAHPALPASHRDHRIRSILRAIVTSVPARVVSSAALPIDIRPLLGPGVSALIPERGSLSRDVLLGELAEADALISLLDVAVDEELLARAPRLRVVANVAVGYDNVDVPAATRRGVIVTNTPGVLTDATADLTFALLLAAARRLVEGDALVRGGGWRGWSLDLLLGADVAGRAIGIVGLGRIGQAVARRARGFDMEILYAGRRPVPAAAELGARHAPLAELLAASDFVTLHVPLSAETRHLIDDAALARMRPRAILINTARGACVDEAALAAALARGAIGGAALDVFESEPAVHPGLLASPAVLLAPHVGSATHATRGRMAELSARAVAAVLAGQRPQHVVNPQVLERTSDVA
jgi:glyoxylate reductase